ncbi:MAG: hypothetical protein ACRDU5_05255 [Mycobacterium sp.]
MDVTLGVSVDGGDARIALLDAAPPHAVIDQSHVDLTAEPIDTLVSALVSTDRMLTETGHRLVSTRICSSDTEQGDALLNALVDADLTNVTVVSQPEAVTEVVRSLSGGETAASLVTAGDTAALSIVDADTDTTSLIAVEPITEAGRAPAYQTLLERFSEEPGGATSVVVVGLPDDGDRTAELAAASPAPLRFPDAPEFALARGAALAGLRQPLSSVVAAQNPSDSMLSPPSQQLAYSEVDDAEEYPDPAAAVPIQTPMRPLSAVDPDEIADDDAVPSARPRMLLVGSTVAAIVIVGFAALAVSVAIGIRPTVSQQAVRMQDEAVAGKYFPVAPGQGVTPDGENWTLLENIPPPGEESDVRTFETRLLSATRGSGNDPTVFELYRDGTVGVQNGLTGIPVDPPPASVGFGQPGIPEFVPRLIPDLSRVNMCQVMSFLSNVQALNPLNPQSPLSVQNTVTSLDNLVSTVDGTNMTELGKVAAVQRGQGALFSTERSDAAESAAPGVGTIPQEIFQTSKSELDATKVLPPGTELIDALPTPPSNGKPGSTPVFGGVIPDVGEVTPGPTGALPDMPDSDPRSTLPGVAQDPKVSVPKPDVTPPVPGRELPDTKLDIPAPKVDVPAPKVELPAPKPPVSIPDPPVSIPDPPVSVPDPPVSIPEPVIPVPEIEIPAFEPPAPAPAAPAAPPVAPKIPFLPDLSELPFGENPFGN